MLPVTAFPKLMIKPVTAHRMYFSLSRLTYFTYFSRSGLTYLIYLRCSQAGKSAWKG
jgi:hypothetical protein